MSTKTYNMGRVVGWSTYEEFLKENPGIDPSKITSSVYSTMVTYGVTRVVGIPITAGDWKPSQGTDTIFYTATVPVAGATYGAVPIVGINYDYYINNFKDNIRKYINALEPAGTNKELLEKAFSCIFTCYVSDVNGVKTSRYDDASGFLTFAAYPDIVDYLDAVAELVFPDGTSEDDKKLMVIVRGLSLDGLTDADELYYGPQGVVITTGGTSAEYCKLSTIDINALCMNASGYIWMSTGGTGASMSRLANQPAGEIMVSTFGYLNPDFVNGDGDFSSLGRYGLTYSEYEDALQGIECIRDQVKAIPISDRNDYLYLVSGIQSYSGLPGKDHPLFIIPVRKSDYHVNVGDESGFSAPKMQRIMDFTKTYLSDTSGTPVLYIPSKVTPNYMGSYWGASCPSEQAVDFTYDKSRWITTDIDDMSEHPAYTVNGRESAIAFSESFPNKGEYLVVGTQSVNHTITGFYQCVADKKHNSTDNRYVRRGAYLNYVLPDWVKNKDNFCWEVDLSGKTTAITDDVLYVDGAYIYPGEWIVIGTNESDSTYRIFYVLNTHTGTTPKLIVQSDLIFSLEIPNNGTVLPDSSDSTADRIMVLENAWDAAITNISVGVYTSNTTDPAYNFQLTDTGISRGIMVNMKHHTGGEYGYDAWRRYFVLEKAHNVVKLASAMIWTDNPNVSAVAGHPARFNSAFPRYNQELPSSTGSYYYNVTGTLLATPATKLFTDFGWDIADYVHTDFQGLNLLQFLQECILRSDMTEAMSPATKRAVSITSDYNLYSKTDLHYTTGQIPGNMSASINMHAATDTRSFYSTAYYVATKISDGSPVVVSNSFYPIWATLGIMSDGTQTMSLSLIDGSGSQLDFSGNSGAVEADTVNWLDLLVGLGSGKSVDVLKGARFGKDSAGITYIETATGVRLYISATEPTGDIPEGSIGIGW